MTILRESTIIRAPIERCFALSLDIDIEAGAETAYQLTAVAGITSGRIGLGQTVTWRTRQFGIWVTHKTQIMAVDRPVYFRDAMEKGVFESFVHDHFFEALPNNQTRMTDELRLSMPWWLGGVVAEKLFIARRVRTMLLHRNHTIQRAAEAE